MLTEEKLKPETCNVRLGGLSVLLQKRWNESFGAGISKSDEK